MDERTLRRLADQGRIAADQARIAQESGFLDQARHLQESGILDHVRKLQETGVLDQVREQVRRLQESGVVDQARREEALRISDELAKNARLVSQASRMVQSLSELEQLRIDFLGRSSPLTEMKRIIRDLPTEVRPQVGGTTNRASRELEEAISSRAEELAAKEREEKLRAEAVDVTLPGVPYPRGSLHPSMRVIDEVVDFFVGLGYRVAEGPEVETDYYNFTALNIPPGHPARGMQDTFFLDEGLVLRTHTSPVQIRTMLSQEPPVYIVCPGRTYRRDSDPTHTPMFNQIEGLAVDKGLTLGHLKGTLAAMARHVFGEGVKVRLRPSYFQFVEPGVELDVSCFVCGGKDPNCKVCKGAGWVEMLGAGMVDPAVLEEVGYDAERYTGFAFGMGPDRMAMAKYGVPDLRLFFEGDLRFLRQF